MNAVHVGSLKNPVLADVPASFLFDVDVDVDDTLGFWVVWGGWVLFALGTMLAFSMRPADFPLALALIVSPPLPPSSARARSAKSWARSSALS